jgi:hypothetical protein
MAMVGFVVDAARPRCCGRNSVTKERVQRALILICLLLNLMSTMLELLFTRETEQDNCVVPR